jgi:TolA-binding protein
MKFAALLVAATVAAFAALPAQAQIDSREGIALQNEISGLQRDINDLRDQIGSGGSMLGESRRAAPVAPPGGSDLVAGLVDRLGRLEENVRDLNGRLDELANQERRDHDDLAKQISDLQFRLDNGGGGAPTAAVAAPPPRPSMRDQDMQTMSPPPAALGAVPSRTVAPPPPPIPAAPGPAAGPRGADQIIQEGSAALARRDYPAAEKAARDVLAIKASPRGYDAQLLLAESLSGQRRSLDAAIAYGDLYARSKQGAHAQDALLGLANSQAALGDKHSACVALDSLTAQFPTPRADIASRAAAARAANGCH